MTIKHRLSIDLGSKEFWDSLQSDPASLAYEVCKINLADLDGTLQTHAALRAWVGAVHEQARVEEERRKFELTKARASALLHARAVGMTEGGKGKTVGVMEAEVEGAPEVTAAQEALLEAMEKRGALRAMTEALGDRRDMLVQLSAKQREEQKTYYG